MNFIRTASNIATQQLYQRLVDELEADKRVVWIISGGSNTVAAVNIMAQLAEALQPNLTIMPVDERYGEVGHADSNIAQLLAAGFDDGHARLLEVLKPGLTMQQTATAYAEVVQAAFDDADIIISQLGIGADGHIAGILPASSAVDSQELVTSYASEPYQRITMTFNALQRITVDYSFAYGDDKEPTLLRLQQSKLPLAEQPAQILRQLPEAYIFNDTIGDQS